MLLKLLIQWSVRIFLMAKNIKSYKMPSKNIFDKPILQKVSLTFADIHRESIYKIKL